MTNPRAWPNPRAYLPVGGLSRNQRTEEQDLAGGGHAVRLIQSGRGTTVAGGVALRCLTDSRRVYAYLRWPQAAVARRRRTSDM